MTLTISTYGGAGTIGDGAAGTAMDGVQIPQIILQRPLVLTTGLETGQTTRQIQQAITRLTGICGEVGAMDLCLRR